MGLLRKAYFIFRTQGFAALAGKVSSRLQAHSVADLRAYPKWLEREMAALSTTGMDSRGVNALLESQGPLFSVLMPVFEPNLQWLEEAINSVVAQGYQKWELCIAEDCSPSANVRAWLEKRAAEEPRIRVIFREANGHIAAATNSAKAMAKGQWLLFLDQDDLLAPTALTQLAHTIEQHQDVALIYSDEDQVSAEGAPIKPFFKPDWSPHLAMSQAYLGHLVCIHKEVLDFELDTDLNGSQDYDLWLRCCSKLQDQHIYHLPMVLYHWRTHPTSTASNADNKPYAQEAGRQAVERFVHHRYKDHSLSVVNGTFGLTYQLAFPEMPKTMVSIIIPTKDKVDLLAKCIESIVHFTTGVSYEFIVLDNRSEEAESQAYFKAVLEKYNNVQVLAADMPFNWSRLNNMGARAANGQVLLFLNNDTEATHADWLKNLAGHALLPDVGVVGALLLFPDGTIQHSGVVVGMGGWADHVFHARRPNHFDVSNPYVSPVLTRNVTAVTGACMALSAEKFQSMGGFDERFEICGSDIDICLTAHRKGYFNVLCAQSQLIHHESKTRGKTVPPVDFYMSSLKYEPYRTQAVDPFFNPNLSLHHTTPALR